MLSVSSLPKLGKLSAVGTGVSVFCAGVGVSVSIGALVGLTPAYAKGVTVGADVACSVDVGARVGVAVGEWVDVAVGNELVDAVCCVGVGDD